MPIQPFRSVTTMVLATGRTQTAMVTLKVMQFDHIAGDLVVINAAFVHMCRWL